MSLNLASVSTPASHFVDYGSTCKYLIAGLDKRGERKGDLGAMIHPGLRSRSSFRSPPFPFHHKPLFVNLEERGGARLILFFHGLVAFLPPSSPSA